MKNIKSQDVAGLKEDFLALNLKVIQTGAVDLKELHNFICFDKSNVHPSLKTNSNLKANSNLLNNKANFIYIFYAFLVFILCVLHQNDIFHLLYEQALGVRCIVPNNYFVWEATRPVSDCDFCRNVSGPIVLHNASRDDFQPYAYTSKPVVVKRAFVHWPAMKYFTYDFFKELYGSIEDSYQSVDEECQFLHFQSNFISIRDVFLMEERRVKNEPGEKSWYVGWGNCHPQILEEMRRYYPKPHFLPEDCEIPSKEYVFMGYDAGATMHLDFINRLMWQAQLKGSKTWNLVPSPECQDVCQPFSFLVEPGDAVLVDTRVWYHGTTITPGEFSLSIQSEYG